MKITKKMKKKLNGMNAATTRAFCAGYRPKLFGVDPKTGQLTNTVIQAGIPYVNEKHFNTDQV